MMNHTTFHVLWFTWASDRLSFGKQLPTPKLKEGRNSQAFTTNEGIL